MHGQPPNPPPQRQQQLRIAAAAGVSALALLLATGIAFAVFEDPPPEPAAAAATSSPPGSPPAKAPPRAEVPRPTPAQARTYIATIEDIDPGLTVNRDRALRRARGICDRIVNPPGGDITLTEYTVYMLSGGNAQIDKGQARRVIRAVKVWCR